MLFNRRLGEHQILWFYTMALYQSHRIYFKLRSTVSVSDVDVNG